MQRHHLGPAALVLALGCRTIEYNPFGEPTDTGDPSSVATSSTAAADSETSGAGSTTSATEGSDSSTVAIESGESQGADTSTADASTSTGTTGGASAVVINELSSSDDDPIELYNAGDADVDLSGYILTDDLAIPYDPDVDLEEFRFPDGTVLAAGEYLVVSGGEGDDLHLFGLSSGGDYVTLYDPSLEVVDFALYADGGAVVSHCRIPDAGEWMDACAATFAGPNGT